MDRRGQVSAYPVQSRSVIRPKTLILTLFTALVVLVVFLNAAKVDSVGRQAVGRLQDSVHNIPRPFSNLHNPFKQQAHPPPVQDNSTLGEASWFSDWKWLNPFSSTITLDEDRALLPPVLARPPVYTYYEPRDPEKEKAVKLAEEQLLEIWRRAWWAQGFRPVILGPSDAMENPLYQKMQTVNTTNGVQTELMRFLAWSYMGDGVLANWLVLPMGGYYSPLLTYLREGRYMTLTRYQDLGMGLFAGPKADVDKAVILFLDDKRIGSDGTLMDLIGEQETLFQNETSGKDIAFYSSKIIGEKYKDVAEAVGSSAAKGYKMLADLINAHLHATFLAQYMDGLSVVSPYAFNATLIPHRAITLAKAINTCPSNPVGPSGAPTGPLNTCPPNNPGCMPCQPRPLQFPPAAPNSTKTFTIGTVPHTYLLTRLMAPHFSEHNFSVAYIRRESIRDPFLEAVTAEIAPPKVGSQTRIVYFKEAVAQPGKGAMRSIWRHAEADWSWEALEWRLGFSLPRPSEPDVGGAHGEPIPQSNIPSLDISYAANSDEDGVIKVPDVLQLLMDKMQDKPFKSDLVTQSDIIYNTGAQLKEKKWPSAGPDLRKAAEAWNLADVEAWRFVRALTAREEVQRKKWMDEERKYRP